MAYRINNIIIICGVSYTEYESINEAKRASRELQKTGQQLKVLKNES